MTHPLHSLPINRIDTVVYATNSHGLSEKEPQSQISTQTLNCELITWHKRPKRLLTRNSRYTRISAMTINNEFITSIELPESLQTDSLKTTHNLQYPTEIQKCLQRPSPHDNYSPSVSTATRVCKNLSRPHKSEKTVNYYPTAVQSDRKGLYYNTATGLHRTRLGHTRQVTRTFCKLREGDRNRIHKFTNSQKFSIAKIKCNN